MGYESVKNTAKDGRLIRAEVREMVLALALVHGFGKNKDKAAKMYPDNELRQKQYTELVVGYEPYAKFCRNIDNSIYWVADALKYYFKYYDSVIEREPYNKNLGITIFYDTKKFRIYYDRIRYGRDNKIRLNKLTMQYFWTKVPLVLWLPYIGTNITQDLDFWCFECVLDSYSIEENMRAISAYISDVCGIPNDYNPDRCPHKLYIKEADGEKLLRTAVLEALRLKQKLYDGGYIELSDFEKYDLRRKDYDYGKKDRNQIRELVSERKNKKNKSPIGQS